MSVSITHPQTLKNISATLVSLISGDNDVAPSRSLQRQARSAVTKLADPTGVESPDVLAAKVYNALLSANKSALVAKYPDTETARQTSKALKSLSVADNALPIASFTKDRPEALAFFLVNIGRAMHGYHEPADGSNEQNCFNALVKLNEAAVQAIVLSNSPSQEIPTVPELAESMTRLYAGGDYLYGMQSGATMMMRRLTAISNQIAEYDGDDTLLTLYAQGRQKTHFTLPFGETVWDKTSVRSQRIGDYRVSGDIPYPVQADVDRINIALEFIRNRLQIVPLLDADMNALDQDQQQHVKSVFERFSLAHQVETQTLRVEPYLNKTDLPFKEAQQKVLSEQTENIPYYVVALNDMPSVPDNVGGHPQTPQRIRQLQEMTKAGAMVLDPTTDDLAVVKSVYPEANVLTFNVSKEDSKFIKSSYGGVSLSTAAMFVLHATIDKAYNALGLPDQDSVLSPQQIANQVNKSLQAVLPGFGDDSLPAVSESISNVYQTAKYTSLVLERNVPEHLKKMLNKSGEIALERQVENIENTPSPSVSVSSPKMQR